MHPTRQAEIRGMDSQFKPFKGFKPLKGSSSAFAREFRTAARPSRRAGNLFIRVVE